MKRVNRQYLVFLILLGASMSGCGNSIFNTEPLVDTHHDDEGNLILSDTPRMWDTFKDDVERGIKKELSGEAPTGGMKTWNDLWIWRIQANFTGRENKKKYIRYVIDRRRQEGLPELEPNPLKIEGG